MKRIFIILCFATCILQISAQPSIFQQANQSYADGDYKTAIILYQQELDSVGPSDGTYYNLGNAYYRSNELGLAILNYERALAINPFHKDAKYNLEIAQSRIIDNVVDNQSFFLSKWINNLINLFKAHTWMTVSLITFLLTLFGLFVYFFSKQLVLRKTGFHIAWISFLFFITTLIFCLVGNSREKSHNSAIIMAGIVNAKASPDRSGTDLFVLHEGTKVHITDELTDWVEIEVGNNKGWIPVKTVERI